MTLSAQNSLRFSKVFYNTQVSSKLRSSVKRAIIFAAHHNRSWHFEAVHNTTGTGSFPWNSLLFVWQTFQEAKAVIYEEIHLGQKQRNIGLSGRTQNNFSLRWEYHTNTGREKSKRSNPITVQSGQAWLFLILLCMWDESSEGREHGARTNHLLHQKLRIITPRYAAEVTHFPCGPTSRLMALLWWLHMPSNPFLEYHPTCKGATLQAVRQCAGLGRVWQISDGYPNNLCFYINVTSAQTSPRFADVFYYPSHCRSP